MKIRQTKGELDEPGGGKGSLVEATGRGGATLDEEKDFRSSDKIITILCYSIALRDATAT